MTTCIAQLRVPVVRLKGGCTSTFSRISSEMAALHAAGIPFEVVPGVTAASAASADSCVPLTSGPDFTALVTVSAHNAEAVDWGAYPPRAVGTLVVYMGARNVAVVAAGCMAAGWPGGTPVAVVRNAGLDSSEKWSTTLIDVEAALSGEDLSPCIIIIGPTASGLKEYGTAVKKS